MLSIHDVMPATLPAVKRLSDQAQALGWPPPTLLVVPGCDWSTPDLQQLHEWQAQGHALAGHGWRHQITHYGGIYHRIHSMLVSRDVAEHLSLNAEAILALMRRCHAWFAKQGLIPPHLYVPPAWALGRLPLSRLSEQPFAAVEMLQGVYSVKAQQWQMRALLGYEAGNGLQAMALRVSNAINRKRARHAGLRIGLHPNDAALPLADALWRDLAAFSPQPPTND